MKRSLFLLDVTEKQKDSGAESDYSRTFLLSLIQDYFQILDTIPTDPASKRTALTHSLTHPPTLSLSCYFLFRFVMFVV